MKSLRSPILRTISQTSLYVIKLMALWFFLRGHQEPGGGFIAGVMMAAAIALQGLAFGIKSAQAIFPVPFQVLLGGGLVVSLSTVVGPMLFGHPMMKHFWGYLYLPFFGKFEWATAALFDLGVFLVVVGSIKAVLLSIAEEKLGEAKRPGEAESYKEVR